MSSPLVSVEASSSVLDASRRMIEKGVKRLAVTENGRVVGVLSQTDIVRDVASFEVLVKAGAM